MFQYSSKTLLIHLEVKLESFFVDLGVDHVTQSEKVFINCINGNNPTYYSSLPDLLDLLFSLTESQQHCWNTLKSVNILSVTLPASRSWRCVLVVKGGPPLPLFSDWMQQERLFSCMAAGILRNSLWSKPLFCEIISQLYTHKCTDPYIEMHVIHYRAAWRPAGCVIKGRDQETAAGGGWLPPQMWLPQGLYDHVSDTSNKSNASTSNTCYCPLEM